MTEDHEELAPPQLDGLATLLPAFEAADAELGEWKGGREEQRGSFVLPWFSPSELTTEFIEVAYRDGWVRPDFDWSEWAQTPDARRLQDDRGVLEQATVLDVARLLTVVIRADRFVEGTLAEALESGLVTAALRRIEQLRREG
ncbi:MAG: hypothetical protein F4X26_05025 [Chloroflexi bacterium]|nr:hypothetical protein [Chloroflexota bacterium]